MGVTPGQSVCSVVSADSALTSPQPAGHKDQVFFCDQCGHEANVTVDLKKHKAEVHKNSAYTCDQCKYMANKTESIKRSTRSMNTRTLNTTVNSVNSRPAEQRI